MIRTRYNRSITEGPIEHSGVFDRIVSKNGKLFRIRFAVIERGGKLRGKVISLEPISELRGSVAEPFVLCSNCSESDAPVEKERTFSSFVSPFSVFDFFTSQMTRAPSAA